MCPKSKVLLVLTNRNVKTDDSDLFSIVYINKAIQVIEQDLKIGFHYEIFALYGQYFEERKEQYLASAKEGKKKLILMTSYPASGTGQNLQYEIEDEETGQKKKQDIDSIYLELPRNMLVNPQNGFNEGDLVKFIYQCEALGQAGDISASFSRSMIRYGFKAMMGLGNCSKRITELYKTNSVNNHAVKSLVQGVGRVCRVGGKTLDTHIYLDDQIRTDVDFSCLNHILLNSEFRAILKQAKQKSEGELDSDTNIHYLNRGTLNNRLDSAGINRYLSDNRETWVASDMASWQALREFVLKHPTIADDELSLNPQYKKLYLHAPVNCKINRYYVETKNNYVESISYSHDLNHHKAVSDDHSPLSRLMENKTICDLFDAKGYAKSFVASDNVITPVIFTNIYKGALGEAVGRALLESCGLKLDEIKDGTKFEKFDFVLADDPDVYVDFKLWHEVSGEDDYDEMSNSVKALSAYEKLKNIKGKKALIINVLAAASNHSKIKGESNILIIPTLLEDAGGEVKINSDSIKQIFQFIQEAC